jgi:hypothetical protein
VSPCGTSWREDKGGTYKTFEEAKCLRKSDFTIGPKSSYSVRQRRRDLVRLLLPKYFNKKN